MSKYPTKSTPRGIDPAQPNRNFVEMYYANRGDKDGYSEYKYPPIGEMDTWPFRSVPEKKPHSFGGSQKAGKLRVSGTKGAHRIGKR
jgi:hypothetical protein